MREINLEHNQLTTLGENRLKNCKELRELVLNNNKLVAIERDTFNGAKSLYKLILDENQINFIHAEAFDMKTPDLQELHLNKNNLESFSCSIKSIEHLYQIYLNDNKLSKINAEMFKTKSGVDKLYLANNRIREFDVGALESLRSSLRELYLSGNQINTLETRTFADMTSLSKLDLASNKLTVLPSDLFKDLTSLEQLDLSENRLKVIQSDWFKLQDGSWNTSLRLVNLYGINSQIGSFVKDNYIEEADTPIEERVAGKPALFEFEEFLSQFN